jgi:transposase
VQFLAVLAQFLYDVHACSPIPGRFLSFRHRSSLKQRIHAVLLTHGKPCPVSDLFGVRGRELLARLGLPEPWAGSVEASLRLIDELDGEIDALERELRRLGAEHRYVPLGAAGFESAMRHTDAGAHAAGGVDGAQGVHQTQGVAANIAIDRYFELVQHVK